MFDISKMSIIFNGREYNVNNYKRFIKESGYGELDVNKAILLMKRSPDLIFMICLCLIKGITYIPIDSTYPIERINYIIENSDADIIINNTDLDLSKVKSTSLRQKSLSTNEVAYILYTSGTTGAPKGVEITREGLKNFIEGISEIIDFSEGKRIACLTTVSFDIFFLESIMAIHKGVTVVLANEEEQSNPKLMADFIVDNKIDMLQLTPSRMSLLLNYDKDLSCLKNVKEIMIGGEPVSINILNALQSKTSARIYNMYGPTETTIWSTVSDLTDKNRIDIGKPIKSTEIYILDENSNILKDGQVGEICIAGKGLAKGYYMQEGLTADKFVYLPELSNKRCYKTGDIGTYLPDGNLEYLGRIDNQVKIRGHRIEVEEIEENIKEFSGIIQCIVKVVELKKEEKVLEAIYTAENDIDINELKGFLTNKLPKYMIPVKYSKIPEFTYTPNGKIDRKHINLITETELQELSTGICLSDMQNEILSVIKSEIDERIFHNVHMDSELTSIGIDSISFINIILSLEQSFNFNFDDEMLLFSAFPTIGVLVEYVETKRLENKVDNTLE